MINAQRVYNNVREILRDPTNTRYSIDRFCIAFNHGMTDVTNELSYFIKTEFATIPAGFNSVDFSRKAVNLVRVEYVDLARRSQVKLEKVGIERLDSDNAFWRNDREFGEPYYYVVNEQNPCNFFVYPLARQPVEGTPTSGILQPDTSITITSDSGVIENLQAPYLLVKYAEMQQRAVPNTDNTGIVFEGTTQAAMYSMQEDVAQALEHYCVAMLASDDSDEQRQQLAQNHLALYNNKLRQIKEKKSQNFDTQPLTIPSGNGAYPPGLPSYGTGSRTYGGSSSRISRRTD